MGIFDIITSAVTTAYNYITGNTSTTTVQNTQAAQAAYQVQQVQQQYKELPKPTQEQLQNAKQHIRLSDVKPQQTVTLPAKAAFHVQPAVKPMSQTSQTIHQKATQVSNVIDMWSAQADAGAKIIQSKLPEGIGKLYEGTYSLGKGIFLNAPKATVQMAGMIPGGVETIVKNPNIIPAAVTTGVAMQVTGLKEGLTQRPHETIGEFIGMGVIGYGVSKSIPNVKFNTKP